MKKNYSSSSYSNSALSYAKDTNPLEKTYLDDAPIITSKKRLLTTKSKPKVIIKEDNYRAWTYSSMGHTMCVEANGLEKWDHSFFPEPMILQELKDATN